MVFRVPAGTTYMADSDSFKADCQKSQIAEMLDAFDNGPALVMEDFAAIRQADISAFAINCTRPAQAKSKTQKKILGAQIGIENWKKWEI